MSRPALLLRRGRILERITLGWNVAGLAVLAVAAIRARSVALAGFGLDSLIEIGASTVVLWELSGTGEDRQRRALRLIGGAFLGLAAYLMIQSAIVLATGHRSGHSPLGIGWTAVTAAAMFALAAGKARTGKALGNPVLVTEGRVTLVDGILAVAVLAGLALNAAAGWWWADPLAALIIVGYALREAREIFSQLADGTSAKQILEHAGFGASSMLAAGTDPSRMCYPEHDERPFPAGESPAEGPESARLPCLPAACPAPGQHHGGGRESGPRRGGSRLGPGLGRAAVTTR